TDSNVSVSPFFDESFKLIPLSLQRQVVEKLKELARTTDRPATTVQNYIKRSSKLKNEIPTIEVAPGVKLAVEFETVGVCFLGFLIAGTERRGDANYSTLPKPSRAGHYLVVTLRWLAFLPLAFLAAWLA